VALGPHSDGGDWLGWDYLRVDGGKGKDKNPDYALIRPPVTGPRAAPTEFRDSRHSELARSALHDCREDVGADFGDPRARDRHKV
jgi:hypothetical protein